MNNSETSSVELPCKTGDVLLRRDENDLTRLYVVDDIERVVDGRIDNGRLVTLYNPETDGYFIENTRSEWMRSITGVIDGTLPNDTDDQLSVELEPVTLLNDNSLLPCKDGQPDAYAVKFAGNVRGLFKEMDSAAVYVEIMKKAEQEGGIVPYAMPLNEWGEAFNDGVRFAGTPKEISSEASAKGTKPENF